MIQLRPYQQEAHDAIFDYWRQGGGNPLVDLATGTGKSVVIAMLVKELIEQYPGFRVLMLTHVKELVAQNFKALLKVWPDAPAGIYSAGLGKRDAHHRITFASIQSVYKKAKVLGARDLIVVDESHLIPHQGEGMYRRLLDDLHALCPDARVAGFTATPYRLDSGRLDAGDTRLFNQTVYSYGIGEGIADGYLSPLISKASATEIDVSKVKKRGGEFVAGSLETAADRVTVQAVEEMVAFGQDRKAWLVFCSGVNHAAHVRDEIRRHGISCEMVCGTTPRGERDSIIRRFRNGEIRCLTNANLLTTGFDAPHIDLLVMLRPTLSTGLYVQIVGRGTRTAQGKENCCVLDFAGNVRRHGPVDAVSIGAGPSASGEDTGKVDIDSVRAKECPECKELVALNATVCKVCGHEWPREDKPRHEASAESEVGILSTEKIKPQLMPVVDWRFDRHEKFGMPDSVRVTYYAGINQYREWVMFDHGPQAYGRACQWWINHGGQTPFPKNVTEALERFDNGELIMPATISVKPNGKYMNIVGRTFGRGEAA